MLRPLRLLLCVLLLLSLAGCTDRENASKDKRDAGAIAGQSAGAPASPAETPARISTSLHLQFDFEAGRVLLAGREPRETPSSSGSLSARLAGGEAADLEEFRILLARQALRRTALDAREEERLNYLAHDLGRRLLGPLSTVLSGAPRWTVSPLAAAPLEALVLPWGNGETRVVKRVVVSYELSAASQSTARGSHRESVDSTASSPSQNGDPGTGRGLLVLIPYTPDLTPVQDDPDTLLWTLRPRMRRVFTVPRIETTAKELEAALHSAGTGYSLILLRARPEEAQALLPTLAHTSSFLWWVRPPREAQSRGYLGEAATRARCLAQVTRLAVSGRGLVVDLWPRDDETMKRASVEWIAGLQAGDPPALALTEAKRVLFREDPAHPGRWAGWIAVGEVDTPLQLRRPGFLRRILSSHH